MQQYAASGCYDTPTENERHQLLSGYYRQINAANLPDGIGKMKQFACWFTHGVGNGSELRRIVHAARTPSEVVEKVESFFESRTAAGVGRLVAAPNGDRPLAAPRSDTSVDAQKDGHIANARKEDPARGPLDADCLEATLGA
jgi:hypothetical protein